MAAQPLTPRTRRAGIAAVVGLGLVALVAACSSPTTGAGWTLGPALSSSPGPAASAGASVPAPSVATDTPAPS